MAHLTIGKVIARSALSKFATRLYPFEKRAAYAITRGHIENDINVCSLCGLCQKKCPTHAIVVNRAEKTWAIERMKCIQCGACVDVCPKKSLTMESTYAAAAATKEVFVMKQERSAAATETPAA
jgi:formate hydrogenlyase subunit 6/NADH:ubiquinone oxidoreductase subunit I